MGELLARGVTKCNVLKIMNYHLVMSVKNWMYTTYLFSTQKANIALVQLMILKMVLRVFTMATHHHKIQTMQRVNLLTP